MRRRRRGSALLICVCCRVPFHRVSRTHVRTHALSHRSRARAFAPHTKDPLFTTTMSSGAPSGGVLLLLFFPFFFFFLFLPFFDTAAARSRFTVRDVLKLYQCVPAIRGIPTIFTRLAVCSARSLHLNVFNSRPFVPIASVHARSL